MRYVQLKTFDDGILIYFISNQSSKKAPWQIIYLSYQTKQNQATNQVTFLTGSAIWSEGNPEGLLRLQRISKHVSILNTHIFFIY